MTAEPRRGLAGRLASVFLRNPLTPLIVIASILLGAVAVAFTPREEEPQIVVPMIDVLAPFPGASPREVETQVTTPLERRLWGIPGVEYVYSTSRRDAALVTVRFHVGEPLEPSLVKVRQEIDAHPELLPAGAPRPTVKLLTIDDVPFLVLTLHGGDLPAGTLRQLADNLAREISGVADASQVQVIGGARRTVRVEPDPARLRSFGVSLSEIEGALQAAEAQLPAGDLVSPGTRIELDAVGFVRSAAELRRLTVASRGGAPVLLEDVATVSDGPEPDPAVILAGSRDRSGFEQAVSIAIAKRKGANATALAKAVQHKVDALRGTLLPGNVTVEVTRNQGETAQEKSNELIEHLFIATLSVIALVGLAMGWRSAAVVAVAVPVTLALTLLLTFLFGYTLNRVTLFALIFSIGILVDDAIVVVENVHRHLHLPGPQRSFARTVLDAVDEVGNPTILATFAVIAAILPMAFVRGLMGPYMRPIPVGASAAMLFSLAIAFVLSPWAALKVFRHDPGSTPREAPPESRLTRLYRRAMGPLLRSAKVRWAFLASLAALLFGATALLGVGVVKVKMLPFDNKSEFQVQLDLPAGTPREDALALGQRLGRRLLAEPEVRTVLVHSGAAAPFSFVGMVRHAFLRGAPEQVDVQVNLARKQDRKAQSHAIAVRVRPSLEGIAHPLGARLKIVEIPPGPPVLDTLVAEVYGPEATRDAYAASVLASFRSTAGIVDVDSTLEPTAPRISLVLDREKASLHGVAPAAVVRTLAAAGQGVTLGSFHVERATNQVPLVLQLPGERRGDLADLLQLTVSGTRGPVPIGELVRVERGRAAREIQHKNLMPVAYVFGDVAGRIESPVYALAELDRKLDALAGPPVPRFGLSQPPDSEGLSLKWDGEWHITLEVFRDLGLAFAVVLVLIYVLVVGWFKSFVVPLVILVPIPLSLVGIVPAHGLFGAFFTATSMIGFIAGAGIIVRNSIILVDFIELKLREGMPLALAVEEAGVVRFRPMLLTAAAVMAGSAVMLADPIFQGLALSLMAGEVAATLLSRFAVPVLYFLVARRGRAADLQREGALARRSVPAERPALLAASGSVS
jgi:multidrug efflux pump subunit AcrB